MNKKGVAWPYIIELILVAIIIFGIIYAFSPQLLNKSKDFIKEAKKTLQTADERQFVPYIQDSDIPEDEKKALSSINTLSYALGTVAKGNYNDEDNPYLCEKSPSIKLTASVISSPSSNVCIKKCDKDSNNKLFCEISGFELPQRKDELGNDKWSDWITGGLGDPKFILSYEQFPQGEDKYWARDAYEISRGWLIFSGVISAAPGAHSAFKSLKGFKFTRKFFGEVAKQATEKLESKVGEELTKKEARQIGLEVADDLKNVEKKLYRKPITTFLKRFGKTKYLITEEDMIRKTFIDMFFEGRFSEEFLDILDNAGFVENLIRSNTKNGDELIKVIDDELAKIVDNQGNTLYKKFLEHLEKDDIIKEGISKEESVLKGFSGVAKDQRFMSGKSSIEKFHFLVAERKVLRKEFPDLFDSPQNPLRNYLDITDEIGNKDEILKKIEEESSRLSKQYKSQNFDDYVKTLSKQNVLDKNIGEFSEELADEIVSLSKLSKSQLKSLLAYKDLLSNLVKYSPDGISIDKKFLEEILESTANNAFPKNEFLRIKALQEFEILSPTLFDSKGTFLGKVVLSNVDDEVIEKLENDILKITFEEIKNNKVKTMYKGMYKNFFGTEYEDGFTEAAKSMIPFSFKTAKKVGLKGGLIAVPVAAGIGYAVDGEGGALIGAGSVIGAPALAAGTAVGALRSVFQHRYLTLAVLFFYSNYFESANAKYEPVGFNALSVTTPNLIGKGREFELSPELYDYFIALKKDKWLLGREDIERFHLVSPCKADITLVTTNCKCKIDSGDELYQVSNGKGQIQLLKNSAKPEKEEFVYLFDKLSDEKKKIVVEECLEDYTSPCLLEIFYTKELLNEFIVELHKVILNAEAFMKDYQDSDRNLKPMENMKMDIESAKKHPEFQKMRKDARFYNYLAVRNGIIIKNPEKESIIKIIDENKLIEPEIFSGFIHKEIAKYGRTTQFISDTLRSMYDVNLLYSTEGNLQSPPFDEFFGKDKILWKIAREYDFHYRKITSQSNLEDAVKLCEYSEETTNADDILELLARNDVPMVFEGSVTAPCIIAKVDVDEAYKKTNEENYCYMGSHFRSNSIRGLIAAGNIAADAFLTGVAGTGVGAVIALPLYVGTGVFAEWLDQSAIPDWPKRG